MSKFKLHIQRTIQGEAEVDAKDLKDAKEKFENGDESSFTDFSEDYPVGWDVKSAEILNEETEEWEEIKNEISRA
jgi:hypothetical protein